MFTYDMEILIEQCDNIQTEMRFCYNATGGGISVVAVDADSTTGTAAGDVASTVSAVVVVKAAVVMGTDAALESDDVVSNRLICSSDGAPMMCLSSSE